MLLDVIDMYDRIILSDVRDQIETMTWYMIYTQITKKIYYILMKEDRRDVY